MKIPSFNSLKDNSQYNDLPADRNRSYSKLAVY